MRLALNEAKKSLHDVPIGAVIIHMTTHEIVCIAHNTVEENSDAMQHAEINAINQIKLKYLSNYEIYCTLQPCKMCMAALEEKRIGRIFFGAYRDQFEKLPKHSIGGVCEVECQNLLLNFFNNIRQN
jgi:tRNA(adenine34) deaminase